MKTQYELARDKLAGMELTPETRKLLHRFEKEHSHVTKQTLANYIFSLARFMEAMGKPLEAIGKDEIIDFFAKAEKKCKKGGKKKGEKYSNGTLNMMRQVIASFYKWKNGGEDPQFIKDAKKTVLKIRHNGNTINADELLTPEDVRKIVGMATSQRDRAFLMVMYESGARIGELLNLQIKDCYFDDCGCRVRLRGKTGERTVRLIDSAADLKAWLVDHPGREKAESPVFVTQHANFGKPVNRAWARNFLALMAKRAGIRKKMNPHSWRHARLTQLARDGFTEPELRKFAGWTADSGQCRTYIHLTDADIERKQLKMSGLISIKETAKPYENALKSVACPSCHAKNSVAARFCCGCGQGLDTESIKRFREQKLATELYRIMFAAPGGIEYLEKLMEENREAIRESLALCNRG